MKRTELITKRTAHRKIFENQDHSRTAEIYLNAVHYQNGEGTWEEMDDTLEENAVAETTDTMNPYGGIRKRREYRNQKGSLHICFSGVLKKEGTASISKGDKSLVWGLENSRPAEAQKENGKEICYPEILKGVDLRLRVQGEQVKEDLILHRAEAVPEKFPFLYRMKNLSPVQKGNRVFFLDEDGEEVFCVYAPYMEDAKGVRSEAIRLRMEKCGEGICRIIYEADREWLLAPERKYPVIIDPVTTTSKKATEIYDAHVSSLNEEYNFQQSIILKTMGGDEIQRSFLKFTLPEMKSGDMVVNARLVLVSLASDGKERTVQVHKVLQDWNSGTINWYNKPIYDETVEDLCKYKGDKQKYVTLDITRMVKDWYQNGQNFGLMLKDDYELSGYTEFLSSDCDNGYQNMRPRIDISYMNYSGLEDYWSYHSQDVGRAGTVHVNDYNGNLIMEHSTLEMEGNRMPISLAHIYNTNNRKENIGYGNGFCLNYHQTLKKVKIAGTDYYQHTDGDGTVHYFYYDTAKKKWKEEAGLELSLIINTGAAEPLVIEDKEKNQKIFSNGGYLIKLRDKNGNTVSLGYSNNRIIKLTDGAGRVTRLEYYKDSAGNPTNLSQVTDPAGRIKKFGYTNNNLTAIADVDGQRVIYTYDSRNMLTSAANVDGYSVKYSYYGTMPYRVKKITEFGGSTEGNSLTLTYGYNSTKFTDHKGRSEIYRFNHNGNLLHIHDGFGHAASGKYNRDGNHVNRLENKTKLQSNVVQLLKDPIIQAKTIGWSGKVSENGAGAATINTNASYCKIGTRSLKAESTALTGYVYWSQNVTAKKGETYTASMYVRASIQQTAEDGGAILRVRYMDKNGAQQLLDSEVIKKTTADFVHLRRTFTLPADASSDTVKIYMVMWHAIGWMCGDMAQLEVGNTASRCNLVDNGDFHLGTTAGFTKKGKKADGLISLKTATPIPVQSALTVTAATADLYEVPTTTAKVMASVVRGQHLAGKIRLSAEGSNWYHVKTSAGKMGYIQTSKVVPYLGGTSGLNSAVVGVSGAILRASASATGTPREESIPKGTCVSLVSHKIDDQNRKWYYLGMQIDKKRYYGYMNADQIIRLCSNRPYGIAMAADNMYTTMSLKGTTAGSVEVGQKVYFRGVVEKNSGEKWYAVQKGKNFVFLPSRYLELQVQPHISKTDQMTVSEPIGGLEPHIYKFVGDPALDKKLTKTLDITGKKGDTYLINAWGRGKPLPETDNDKNRRFGVEVVFTGADGKTDVHKTNFSPDILDWQFLSDVYVAKQDYTGIQVSYTYCRNANTAFFDGLSLYREEFGQTYTYDSENNLISVVNAEKKAVKFEYGSAGDMTGIVDTRGKKFTYAYDAKHNITKGTSAAGAVYRLQYDSAGNVVKSGQVRPDEQNRGIWMTREFTGDKNHISAVKDAENNRVQYAWDLNRDLLSSVTDARGSRLTYAYDNADRLVSVSQDVILDGEKQTVKNTYTYAKDKMTAIDHNGFRYGFAYDAFGNLLTASVAGKQVAGYTYEAKNGKLSKILYGNGDYIRYTYDTQDRPVLSYYKKASDSAEQKLHGYVYDKQGNLSQVTSYMAGKTYGLDYDLLDRLMRVTDEQGNIYEYTYDSENNLVRMHHASGSSAVSTGYTYDEDGREVTVKAGNDHTRTTFYDSLGRVAERTWSTGNPLTVSYDYPETDSVTSGSMPTSMRIGGKLIAYAYDENGNITSIGEVDSPEPGAASRTDTYAYNELNQLIRENSETQNRTFVYSYDAGGNLLAVKEYAYTTEASPTEEPLKTETGLYDSAWKDKLMEWDGIAMTYDTVGNMLTKGTTNYTWTQGRKLSGVNNGKNIRYFYDHTGARIRKTVDGKATEYCMAGDLLISEKTGGQTCWYRYDSSGNVVSVNMKGSIYFYVRNLQNDIVGLIDAAGNTVVHYTYNSWGKVLSITGSLKDTVGAANPFRYRGYYYDHETGMYYLKSRYYDPEIRRFISADDIGILKVQRDFYDKNLFAYCDSNPAVRKDAEGDFWVTAAAAAIGAAVNITTTYIAAKATGQDYGLRDAAVAGLSGAVNVIPKFGPCISGVISGLYACYVSREGGASLERSIAVGLVSGICTTASISNVRGLVNPQDINLEIIAVNASADLTFGAGYNSIAAATYKGVTSSAGSKSMSRASAKPQLVNMVPAKRELVEMIPVKRNRIVGYGARYNPRTGTSTRYTMYAR